jgi:hypothetical protein
MISVDGASRSDGTASAVFHPVPPPDTADLQALVQRIAERLGRMLGKRGLIERDAESAWRAVSPPRPERYPLKAPYRDGTTHIVLERVGRKT